MIKNSDGFSPNWFLEQKEKPENIYRDFKEILYRVGRGHDEENFGFIRDIIAFANIARHTGKSCYILFGVKDKSRELIDTKNQHPFANCCPPLLNDKNVSMAYKQESIISHYRQIIKKWINNEPKISLRYGEVEGKLVSYLEVEPTYSNDPFSLSEDYKGNKGKVYIRKGSSTEEITQEDARSLFSASKIKYLSFNEWKSIADYYSTGDFYKAATINPPFDVKTTEGLIAQDFIEDEIKKGKKSIVILAAAGAGKTILLQRITFRAAQDLLSFLQSTPLEEQEDIFSTPKKSVPIHLYLRTVIESKNCIDKLIIKELINIGINIDNVNQLFNIPDSRWIILFDGIDELRNRREAGPILRSWIRELPINVQVVLTSRPGFAENLTELDIPLNPLNENEIRSIIFGKLHDKVSELNHNSDNIEIIENIIDKFLVDHPSILEILNRNRAIDGFLSYCIANYTIEKPLLDQDIVNINHNEMIISFDTTESSQLLPKISEDEIVNENGGSEVNNDDPDNKNEAPLNLPLSLPLAIQKITEYMQLEEIKRQKDFGEDAFKIADRATHELSELAWNLQDIRFSCREEEVKKIIIDQSIEWNEFIGFIKLIEYPNYIFWCELLKDYFAAYYGYKTKVAPSLIKESKNSTIKRLLIDLFTANGMNVIQN